MASGENDLSLDEARRRVFAAAMQYRAALERLHDTVDTLLDSLPPDAPTERTTETPTDGLAPD